MGNKTSHSMHDKSCSYFLVALCNISSKTIFNDHKSHFFCIEENSLLLQYIKHDQNLNSHTNKKLIPVNNIFVVCNITVKEDYNQQYGFFWIKNNFFENLLINTNLHHSVLIYSNFLYNNLLTNFCKLENVAFRKESIAQ